MVLCLSRVLRVVRLDHESLFFLPDSVSCYIAVSVPTENAA